MSDNDSSTNNPQEQNSEDWLKAAADWWSEALSEAGAGFRARLDREAKKPRKPVEAVPLTDFDRHFQELVGPRLEGYIRLGAYLLRLRLESYAQAHHRVMAVARSLGAMRLSEPALFALEDWIGSQLLAGLDADAPEGVVTPEQLTRIRREVP